MTEDQLFGWNYYLSGPLLIFPLPSPPPILTPKAQLHLLAQLCQSPLPNPCGFLGPSALFLHLSGTAAACLLVSLAQRGGRAP